MQIQTEANRLVDPEEMAAVYLAKYYRNEEIEYPINPFQMLKDEGTEIVTKAKRLQKDIVEELSYYGVQITEVAV